MSGGQRGGAQRNRGERQRPAPVLLEGQRVVGKATLGGAGTVTVTTTNYGKDIVALVTADGDRVLKYRHDVIFQHRGAGQ